MLPEERSGVSTTQRPVNSQQSPKSAHPDRMTVLSELGVLVIIGLTGRLLLPSVLASNIPRNPGALHVPCRSESRGHSPIRMLIHLLQ